jgi:hypothetical protein
MVFFFTKIRVIDINFNKMIVQLFLNLSNHLMVFIQLRDEMQTILIQLEDKLMIAIQPIQDGLVMVTTKDLEEVVMISIQVNVYLPLIIVKKSIDETIIPNIHDVYRQFMSQLIQFVVRLMVMHIHVLWKSI